eukprot:TRINITY_DN29192_c0_g1_i1.p1 TRINITY_DN29192_c0_g1~~TRINITY_DN29192_c0_g1_i1.p1  ORF type:complete len:189 (+),score=22.35 TRINITY_DN29192_c0_g1_i1:239-805(+)
MLSTGYFLTELEQLESVEFAQPQGQPEPGQYEVAEFPAAQVRSTVQDLCKWLLLLTAPRADPDHCVLSRTSIAEMLPASFERSLAWWGMDALYGERIPGVYSHGGFMQGVRTHIYLWPATAEDSWGAGCVVLLNGEADYSHVVAEMKLVLSASSRVARERRTVMNATESVVTCVGLGDDIVEHSLMTL